MREQAEENAKEIKERLSGQDASEEHAGTASETTPSCTPCQNNGQGDHAEGTTTDDRTAIPTDDKDSKEDKKKPKEKHKNDILGNLSKCVEHIIVSCVLVYTVNTMVWLSLPNSSTTSSYTSSFSKSS